MENDQKIYTNKTISIATFFGGPFAAGFLIGNNYKIFGDDDKRRNSIILGLISTIVFFEILFLIPEKIINSIPNAIFPAIYTGIIYFIVTKTQDKKINEYLENGYKKASGWKAAGIGLLCSLFLIGYIFIRAYNMPAFEGELMTFGNNMHEIYYNENIPQNEVNIVGQELISYGYFNTPEKQTVQLTIEDDNYYLKIPVQKDWWDDNDIVESLKALQNKISFSMNNRAIQIIMIDGSMSGIIEKNIN